MLVLQAKPVVAVRRGAARASGCGCALPCSTGADAPGRTAGAQQRRGDGRAVRARWRCFWPPRVSLLDAAPPCRHCTPFAQRSAPRSFRAALRCSMPAAASAAPRLCALHSPLARRLPKAVPAARPAVASARRARTLRFQRLTVAALPGYGPSNIPEPGPERPEWPFPTFIKARDVCSSKARLRRGLC